MNPLHEKKFIEKGHFLLGVLLFLVVGCSKGKKERIRGEYVHRLEQEVFFTPAPCTPKEREKYPWEEKYLSAQIPRITREFFRCHGDALHPVIVIKKEGQKEPIYFRDCEGRHSLPLRDGKEFIFPVLMELLNHVQGKTGKKVVITSGHRCPAHNAYVDSSASNWGSKHMVGAEVDFYVEGLEEAPEQVVEIVQGYYRETAGFQGRKEYEKFERGEKGKLVTPPWYNKEIFIKVQGSSEGRNFDNRHGHAYITIQVRYDREKDQKVGFSQKEAENYLRN